jgi:hypothetical protein
LFVSVNGVLAGQLHGGIMDCVTDTRCFWLNRVSVMNKQLLLDPPFGRIGGMSKKAD